jgi:hypothetical protein
MADELLAARSCRRYLHSYLPFLYVTITLTLNLLHAVVP